MFFANKFFCLQSYEDMETLSLNASEQKIIEK
jgi:hypothetical protein